MPVYLATGSWICKCVADAPWPPGTGAVNWLVCRADALRPLSLATDVLKLLKRLDLGENPALALSDVGPMQDMLCMLLSFKQLELLALDHCGKAQLPHCPFHRAIGQKRAERIDISHNKAQQALELETGSSAVSRCSLRVLSTWQHMLYMHIP